MKSFPDRYRQIKVGDWVFNEIEISDQQMFSEYMNATEYPIDVFSWNFVFIWSSRSSDRKILWKLVDGMLVIFAHYKRERLYLWSLPFGRGDIDKVVSVLYKCMSYCYSYNGGIANKTTVKSLNAPQLEYLKNSPDFSGHFSYKRLKGEERIFSIPDLISLSGSEFRTLRQKQNKFRKLYPDAVIRKCKADDHAEIMELQENWNKISGSKYNSIFDSSGFGEVIKNHEALNHIVLVAEKDSRIIGVVTGGISACNEVWGCFLKSMKEYTGLGEVLMLEFVREINRLYPSKRFLNAGSDLGIEGLRNFKLKFNPVMSLNKYRVYIR